ncbi:MAG: ABC transporter permease, partial [Cytophagia bacterium]|nr:ABC transporter permease [Cytophagia bacterium]
MKAGPPKLAERFLSFYCKNEFQEEILGDLYERFEFHVEKYGTSKAKRLYWLNVFKFIRGYRLRTLPNSQNSTNNIVMFKNYFKIAFRNAARHKAYSFINIAGLMVGLTS